MYRLFVIISFVLFGVTYLQAAENNSDRRANKVTTHSKQALVISPLVKPNTRPQLLNFSSISMVKLKKNTYELNRSQPHTVLPSLFNQKLSVVNISGSLLESLDKNQRGEIDGAEIRFQFRQ